MMKKTYTAQEVGDMITNDDHKDTVSDENSTDSISSVSQGNLSEDTVQYADDDFDRELSSGTDEQVCLTIGPLILRQAKMGVGRARKRLRTRGGNGASTDTVQVCAPIILIREYPSVTPVARSRGRGRGVYSRQGATSSASAQSDGVGAALPASVQVGDVSTAPAQFDDVNNAPTASAQVASNSSKKKVKGKGKKLPTVLVDQNDWSHIPEPPPVFIFNEVTGIKSNVLLDLNEIDPVTIFDLLVDDKLLDTMVHETDLFATQNLVKAQTRRRYSRMNDWHH